jgi:competence protein ComEC
MWLIWYYILVSGRSGSSLSIILLTALIMIIISPFSLNYDVSLHLSFLAVLWIIYSQNFFEKVFKFLPNFLEIRTAFVLTLSALVFTLPIMIFNFWQVSLLAPIANIAVTWTIPIAMLLWFLSILVYFVFPFLAYIIWYFTWIFLKWDMLVVNFFGNLDWSLLKMDFWFFKNYIEIIYFIIMIFLIIYFRKK